MERRWNECRDLFIGSLPNTREDALDKLMLAF